MVCGGGRGCVRCAAHPPLKALNPRPQYSGRRSREPPPPPPCAPLLHARRLQRHWTRYMLASAIVVYAGAQVYQHSALAGSDDIERLVRKVVKVRVFAFYFGGVGRGGCCEGGGGEGSLSCVCTFMCVCACVCARVHVCVYVCVSACMCV